MLAPGRHVCFVICLYTKSSEFAPILKPHTDEQFFLDKLYFLVCTAKIDKFSLTRTLVEKLVMPAFQPGAGCIKM